MTNDREVTLELMDDEAPAVFENERYEVALLYVGPDGPPFDDGRWQYHSFYGVRNKQTGIVEHTCVQLPEAIYTAVGLAAALDKAPWNWAAEVADAALVN